MHSIHYTEYRYFAIQSIILPPVQWKGCAVEGDISGHLHIWGIFELLTKTEDSLLPNQRPQEYYLVNIEDISYK